MDGDEGRRALDWLVFGLVVVALTLARPIWSGSGAPWWIPFALWAAMIGLGVVLSTRGHSESGDR